MEKEMKETMTSAFSAKLALFRREMREIVEKADILFAGRLWLITMAALGFAPVRPGDMLFFIRFALLILLLHTAAVHFTASLLGGKDSAKGLLAGFALAGSLYIITFILETFFHAGTLTADAAAFPLNFAACLWAVRVNYGMSFRCSLAAVLLPILAFLVLSMGIFRYTDIGGVPFF